MFLIIESILFLTILILLSFFTIKTLGWMISPVVVEVFVGLRVRIGGLGIRWDEFGFLGALGFGVEVRQWRMG